MELRAESAGRAVRPFRQKEGNSDRLTKERALFALGQTATVFISTRSTSGYSPDEREHYAAAQRQARIDPNPHQIDAVMFALRHLREGGCILADEVGLGKTIEAGLVIAKGGPKGLQANLDPGFGFGFEPHRTR